jgi:hypothetical protein
MKPLKSILLWAPAVFLSGSIIQAQPNAGPAAEATGAVERADVRHHETGDAAGDATKPVLPGSGQSVYQPLTGKQRWNLYLRDAFLSPGAYFKAAGPALGAQLGNEPAAWGQGMEGYGKRFANRFGRNALQETYEAAGAALLQHEVRYIRRGHSGFLQRAVHALTANFVTYDRSGRRTPHVARVGSVVAAEFTGNLWMPAGYRDASTAMQGAGMQLGVGSAFNLIREFAPELTRLFKRR